MPDLFLNNLTKALEFDVLEWDEKGACLLTFHEESIEVLFERDETFAKEQILLSSDLGSIHSQSQKRLLKESLQANRNHEEILSLGPQNHTLFLHRRVHAHISAKALKPLVERFVSRGKQWREKVALLSKSQHSDSQGDLRFKA